MTKKKANDPPSTNTKCRNDWENDKRRNDGMVKIDRRRSSLLRRYQKHKRRHHKIELRDGRTMYYLVDGPNVLEEDPTLIKDSGLPVIFAFHGMYLSGESLVLTDDYREQQLCSSIDGTERTTTRNSFSYVIVAVNRAGYHGSSNVKLGEYSYREFALDVGEIADCLGIARFGVVGHSSGGPNVLACAAILGPKRVLAFCTLGSDPEYSHFDDIPYNPIMDCCIGLWLPRALRIFFPCIRVANGMRNDYILERLDYPFECEEIEQRGVVIAGEEDTILPAWLSKRVKDRLKNAQYAVVPRAGHKDLLKDELLDAVYHTVVELMVLGSSGGERSTDDDNDTTRRNSKNDKSCWQNLSINKLIRARTGSGAS